MDDYSNYKDGDLEICDVLCDACAFRIPEDLSRCRKYPQGKPEETLDPDYFCPQFAVTGLDFDRTGEESHG